MELHFYALIANAILYGLMRPPFVVQEDSSYLEHYTLQEFCKKIPTCNKICFLSRVTGFSYFISIFNVPTGETHQFQGDDSHSPTNS